MDFDIQSLKVFVSPKEITHSILQKRIAKVSAKKPIFRLVFLHPIVSFLWLFCIFATFLSAVLSLSLVGKILTDAIHQLLPLFLGGIVFIPLASSIFSLQQRQNKYRSKLDFCRKESITEDEISEYFKESKSIFLTQYEESVNYLNCQFSYSSKMSVDRHAQHSPEVKKVQEKVSNILNRLEKFKYNYLSRLELLENNFIEQIHQGQEEVLLESAAEFELVLEHFNREIDIANTYLKAAGEVDGSTWRVG